MGTRMRGPFTLVAAAGRNQGVRLFIVWIKAMIDTILYYLADTRKHENTLVVLTLYVALNVSWD